MLNKPLKIPNDLKFCPIGKTLQNLVTLNSRIQANISSLVYSSIRLFWTATAQTSCGLHPQTLCTILPSNGQNKHHGKILLDETSVIYIMVGHFDYKHRCLVEQNVPMVFILPSRWQDGEESVVIACTCCLWLRHASQGPIQSQRKLFPLKQD